MMIPLKDEHPSGQVPVLMIGILLSNVGIFVYAWLLGDIGSHVFSARYGAIPFEIIHGVDAISPYPHPDISHAIVVDIYARWHITSGRQYAVFVDLWEQYRSRAGTCAILIFLFILRCDSNAGTCDFRTGIHHTNGGCQWCDSRDFGRLFGGISRHANFSTGILFHPSRTSTDRTRWMVCHSVAQRLKCQRHKRRRVVRPHCRIYRGLCANAAMEEQDPG